MNSKPVFNRQESEAIVSEFRQLCASFQNRYKAGDIILHQLLDLNIDNSHNMYDDSIDELKLYIINNMAHFYQIGFKGFDLRTNRYLFQEIFTILDSIDHQIFLNSKF